MLHNIPEEQWSKREGVQVKCKKCDVGLCLGECFQEYYTILRLWCISWWWQVLQSTTHHNKPVCNRMDSLHKVLCNKLQSKHTETSTWHARPFASIC